MILLFVFQPWGTLLAIIGWILVLIAVSNIADVVKDRSIFRDMMIAVILAIVGIVIGVVVVIASALRFVHQNGWDSSSGLAALRSLNRTSFASGSVVGLGTPGRGRGRRAGPDLGLPRPFGHLPEEGLHQGLLDG